MRKGLMQGRRRHWLGRGLLLGLVLVWGLSACSAPVQEKAQPIRIALTQDILSFDPMLTSDIYSEAVLRCVYTSLFDFDEKLGLRNKLAEESRVVDDRTWEVKIREEVTFHDGSPLTVEDVIFSIERARKGGRTEKMLEMVESVDKVDDFTFSIRIQEPYPDFLMLFAKAETSIVSQKVVEAPGYDFVQPVGAGPFQLLSREENSKVSLERFDGYYLEKAATPLLDFVVIMSEQDRTAAFLNGEVDLLFAVSAYDCDKLQLSPGVKLLQMPSTKIEYLSLNTQRGPLADPKVRLAISYAVNRENIASGVYHGYSVPSAAAIPKGITGYVESGISYDPEKAKALLKEAGVEEGFSFTAIAINTIRKNTLEYIKLDLAEVGITLDYQLVTMKEAVDQMTAGTHDAILVGWAYNPDPNGVLPLVFGTGSGKTMNSSNYSNPQVDDLITQARGTADAQEKEALYQEINRILIQEAPVVVLQNPMILAAARTEIEGTFLNAQGLYQYESLYRKK